MLSQGIWAGRARGRSRRASTVEQALVPNAASFSRNWTSAEVVGRTPWSAAGPLAGPLGRHETDSSGERRVRGDPRGPGGPPHNLYSMPADEKSLRHWARVPAPRVISSPRTAPAQ